MIIVKNLTVSFNNRKVLNNISFEMKENDRIAIIGPSGEGKSVLLKCLLGLITPDRGTIEIDGINIREASKQEIDDLRVKIGVLFQGSALFDFMNVGENVSFPLTVHEDLEENEKIKRVKETLDLVGLKGSSEKMPDELSGGMQKRVALARAIIRSPKLMFYDEPVSGLDPVRSKNINELIGKLNKEMKLTSVTVTHDMISLDKIANKVLFLLKSKIEFYDDVKNIKNSKILLDFIKGSAELDK